MTEFPEVLCPKCSEKMEKMISGGIGFRFQRNLDKVLPKPKSMPRREDLL